MCGIVGVFSPGGKENVAELAVMGTRAVAHRGPDGAGVTVVERGQPLQGYRGLGRVLDIMPDRGRGYDVTMSGERSEATAAYGQALYSTYGKGGFNSTQPIHSDDQRRVFVTNGEVKTADYTAALFGVKGVLPSDSFYQAATYNAVADLSDIPTAIKLVSPHLHGAYASIFGDSESMTGFCGPLGIRPLSWGRLPGGGVVFASENIALNKVGAIHDQRDVMPGQMVTVHADGSITEDSIVSEIEQGGGICGMEFAYLAHPASTIRGRSVYDARVDMGRRLARVAAKKGIIADIVCDVPRSGFHAALGYSRELKIPYEAAVVPNGDVGRTFLGPNQLSREQAAEDKFDFVDAILKGRRVAVNDDSLIRGTVSRVNARRLREAGATEVHFGISSPMVMDLCHFGIKIDDREKLIANICKRSEPAIAQYIGADTVTFLPVGEFKQAIQTASRIGSVCVGCMTGRYPVRIPDHSPPSGDATPLYGPHSV